MVLRKSRIVRGGIMKIKKYLVETFREEYLIYKRLYDNEEKALQVVKSTHGAYLKAEYKGTVEIDLYCESCDKDLKPGDEYLKVDEYTRYCSDCYEEESYTYYTVGGDQVADENDGEVYDEWDTEAEVHEV